MDAKTALIFGVSGQDGAYLAEFLIGKGYKVHGTTRRRPGEPYLLWGQSSVGFSCEHPLENFQSIAVMRSPASNSAKAAADITHSPLSGNPRGRALLLYFQPFEDPPR